MVKKYFLYYHGGALSRKRFSVWNICKIFCQQFQDMMKFLNWTRAAILYEDEFGLVRLQDLVRTPPMKNLELYIRQTNPENYR